MRKENLRPPASWFFSFITPLFLVSSLYSAECLCLVCTGVPVPPLAFCDLAYLRHYVLRATSTSSVLVSAYDYDLPTQSPNPRTPFTVLS